MSIELMMPSNHLILCSPLLLLPSIFPSIRVFSSESALECPLKERGTPILFPSCVDKTFLKSGLDGEGGGKEVQEGGYIRTPKADSC